MIASMFNLDHRLAELRPSEAELRLARARRDAAWAADRPATMRPGSAGRAVGGARFGSQRSRAAAG